MIIEVGSKSLAWVVVLKTSIDQGFPSVVEHFTNAVEPILKRQDLLEQENQQLAQLRDWLLPLLMNGQVTVA